MPKRNSNVSEYVHGVINFDVLNVPVILIEIAYFNAAIAERLGRQPENQPDTAEELRSFWDRLWQRALRRAA